MEVFGGHHWGDVSEVTFFEQHGAISRSILHTEIVDGEPK